MIVTPLQLKSCIEGILGSGKSYYICCMYCGLICGAGTCRTVCGTIVLYQGFGKVLYRPVVGIADLLDVKCGYRLFPRYIGALY
jgi:hypothetical protein